MKTLIELFDERAIENVLGPEMFRPEQVVYLCPAETAQDHLLQRKLADYFHRRGLDCGLRFLACSLYDAEKILDQLQQLVREEPDSAIDITGGTDAALFAAGMLCQKYALPAFTWSRTKNCFFSIHGSAFAEPLHCDLKYSVEDFFRMTGGTMRRGRVDNAVLAGYQHLFEPWFRLFLDHRRAWADASVWFQRASCVPKGQEPDLRVSSPYTVKGEHGSHVSACEEILQGYAQLGFLQDLRIVPGESVSFTFADQQIRTWMRDQGSVLEMYMYLLCRRLDIFQDVVSSAVVDWDGTVSHESVSNELDVVAARGVVPLFISCKTCEIRTEALNELAILKDRFGGKGAKAIIVSTELCNAAARHRAAQLGIAVIDLEELQSGDAEERIRIIMKAEKKKQVS